MSGWEFCSENRKALECGPAGASLAVWWCC